MSPFVFLVPWREDTCTNDCDHSHYSHYFSLSHCTHCTHSALMAPSFLPLTTAPQTHCSPIFPCVLVVSSPCLFSSMHGDPLDAVHPKYKEGLTEDLAEMVNRAAAMGLDVPVVLPVLREFLVTHLQKVNQVRKKQRREGEERGDPTRGCVYSSMCWRKRLQLCTVYTLTPIRSLFCHRHRAPDYTTTCLPPHCSHPPTHACCVEP